ncbi:uncharacterized protein FOMMEDRAFT_141076 [Fomitiporia mediterranea MF3/22]|uniref:uncharacterized protein n=1 Tax=Fomitiporia mediterranea (strain MF3/22) TaxID=694068 RepID=UPI0004409654|nr:uncharacterized protein FOMMEDRAFT_141076 [Fomitiporia mediterranea MF3/22]EJD01822.1 hypothetical protein FOMMEDRAFT_141076 [Fomitiporia mediterranea MF3/22]
MASVTLLRVPRVPRVRFFWSPVIRHPSFRDCVSISQKGRIFPYRFCDSLARIRLKLSDRKSRRRKMRETKDQ